MFSFFRGVPLNLISCVSIPYIDDSVVQLLSQGHQELDPMGIARDVSSKKVNRCIGVYLSQGKFVSSNKTFPFTLINAILLHLQISNDEHFFHFMRIMSYLREIQKQSCESLVRLLEVLYWIKKTQFQRRYLVQ